jgi:endoglycosylceramidase
MAMMYLPACMGMRIMPRNKIIAVILLAYALSLPANTFAGTESAWLSTQGNHFVASGGSRLDLRGFVTITNYFDGTPVTYTEKDFQRMRELGANYQSIRIGAKSIGAWGKAGMDPAYLPKLDSMVLMAKQAGMHTNFKLTIYDVDEFMGLWKKRTWRHLWENNHREQEQIVQAWKVLWEHFKDEPSVIGYDLLNEPEKGGLAVSQTEFEQSYLTPFYQKAIATLQSIDQRHYAMFQPMYDTASFSGTLNASRIIYAPHFYPNFRNYFKRDDFSTRTYIPTLNQFLRDADRNHATLFIGEYGMPWKPGNDGNATLEKQYEDMEFYTVSLFKKYGLGYSRPWYADDKAAAHFLGITLNWAVIKGTGGLDGPLRTIITDPFARAAQN